MKYNPTKDGWNPYKFDGDLRCQRQSKVNWSMPDSFKQAKINRLVGILTLAVFSAILIIYILRG